MTIKYPVAVERSQDGSWCAYTLSPTVITGLGTSREAALADLESAAKFWMVYMNETGQAVPDVGVEVISMEVAA
jgi:predicted RNase H-like HicB family nuclease